MLAQFNIKHFFNSDMPRNITVNKDLNNAYQITLIKDEYNLIMRNDNAFDDLLKEVCNHTTYHQ